MPLHFAFSTTCTPDWDAATLASRAKTLGYSGVELSGLDANTSLATAILTDPAAVLSHFQSASIAVACVATPTPLTNQRHMTDAGAQDLRRFIDTAAALDCRLLKIADPKAKPGQPLASLATAFARWLVPLADYAAEQNIQLVIENVLSFRTSKQLWMLLETINHPAVNAAWDVYDAATVGESPATSVPTLNSRIQYVPVKDAKLTPAGVTPIPLGEGDLQLPKLLHRLRGIGYDGWITVDPEPTWISHLPTPEQFLPASLAKLKSWTTEPPKATLKKPAARPAPAGR